MLVSGYEAFQLTYDLLTNFELDTSPGPGFADSWVRSPDKVTYHIRDGMKWSDGTPATSKDVCYSWGLAMAAIADDTNVGAGYLDPNVKDAGVTKIECPDDSTFVAYTTDQSDRIFQVYVPILPEHVYGKVDYKKMADEKFDGAARRDGSVHPGRMEDRPVRPLRAQPQLLGPAGVRGRGRAPVLPGQRRRDVPGAQERASSTTRTT